jgi:hypothetical protein
MTQFGTLRVWAALLTFIGVVGSFAAVGGSIVWAFEVDGFWPTFGVLLFGVSVSVVLAVLALALSQALRAIADVGEIVSAR